MQFANICWEKINSQPYSVDFNDVYFNSENGLAETEYVFIAQNQLQSRFQNLSAPTFTIIETGFGTGLNFFCAATHFLSLAPANAKLIFISIEKFPLTPIDMQKAVNFWPKFATIASEFLAKYIDLKPNLNNINIAKSRIQLALWAGDVLDVLPQISQKVDAWFLDGFAPAKNAEMWSNDVFKHLARLSQTGTTFATFTSAGAVRIGLQAIDFNVKKKTGFGKKREMLSGVYLKTAKP